MVNLRNSKCFKATTGALVLLSIGTMTAAQAGDACSQLRVAQAKQAQLRSQYTQLQDEIPEVLYQVADAKRSYRNAQWYIVPVQVIGVTAMAYGLFTAGRDFMGAVKTVNYESALNRPDVLNGLKILLGGTIGMGAAQGFRYMQRSQIERMEDLLRQREAQLDKILKQINEEEAVISNLMLSSNCPTNGPVVEVAQQPMPINPDSVFVILPARVGAQGLPVEGQSVSDTGSVEVKTPAPAPAKKQTPAKDEENDTWWQ